MLKRVVSNFVLSDDMPLSFVSYDAQFTLIIRFKSVYISANSRYYVPVDCFYMKYVWLVMLILLNLQNYYSRRLSAPP